MRRERPCPGPVPRRRTRQEGWTVGRAPGALGAGAPDAAPSGAGQADPGGCTVVTGASGLIGRAVSAALGASRPVLALSRRDPELGGAPGVTVVRGDFARLEQGQPLGPPDLAVHTVVHLAAVTGGCSEDDALRVNVAGTLAMMGHMAARGCRRFILAGSIAAVGIADPAFQPRALPIADDHPCLARDAYGMSKHLMEDAAAYAARRFEGLDVLCLRLASVADDRRLPPLRSARLLGAWGLGGITVMALSDAVRLLVAACDAPLRPGFRVRNAAPARAWVRDPMARFLEAWYGDAVDTGPFLRPGHEFDSPFDVSRLETEVGFTARLPAPPSQAGAAARP